MTTVKKVLSFVPDVLVMLVAITWAAISLLGGKAGLPADVQQHVLGFLIISVTLAGVWTACFTCPKLATCIQEVNCH